MHIRALDGLRGIAVLMVMVLHFYPKWLIAEEFPRLTPIIGRIVAPGAWGVPLFFVLSGFLITGILLDTKGQPAFLLKFYARRTLRIFPLYYGALFSIFFVLPHLVPFDAGAQAISLRQGWLWGYLSNWTGSGPWDDSALFNLNHFWSLCVEEHFYLFWPVAVSLLSPRQLAKLALGLMAMSLALRFGRALAGSPLFMWSSLNNLDGLAIGALIAIAPREPSLSGRLPYGGTYRRLLWVFILAALAYVMLPRRLNLPIFDAPGETVIAVCFGLVMLGVLRLSPGEAWHRVLTSGPLVTFGKYSYGLYVIHGILRPPFERLFDLNAFPDSHGLPLLWMLIYYALTFGASLALAWLSYHGFEKWFLRLKRHFDYASVKAN